MDLAGHNSRRCPADRRGGLWDRRSVQRAPQFLHPGTTDLQRRLYPEPELLTGWIASGVCLEWTTGGALQPLREADRIERSAPADEQYIGGRLACLVPRRQTDRVRTEPGQCQGSRDNRLALSSQLHNAPRHPPP